MMVGTGVGGVRPTAGSSRAPSITNDITVELTRGTHADAAWGCLELVAITKGLVTHATASSARTWVSGRKDQARPTHLGVRKGACAKRGSAAMGRDMCKGANSAATPLAQIIRLEPLHT